MEVIGRTSLIVEVKPGVYYGKHILGDPLFKLTDDLKSAKKFELTDTQKAQNTAELVFGKVKELTITYTLEDTK